MCRTPGDDRARWHGIALSLTTLSLFHVAASLAAVPSPAIAPTMYSPLCPSRPVAGAIVHDPPTLYSRHGRLQLTLSFRRSVGDDGRAHFCYVAGDGSEAPTLRVHPADQVVLTLRNDVPASESQGLPRMRMAIAGGCTPDGMNALSTNLHFHGLSLPPSCHHDEVLSTHVQPGGKPYQYRFRIPVDTPAGVYWYHPHVHGFSSPQVLGGASGALIVDARHAGAAVAGLPERVLLIRDQDLIHPDAQPDATDSMPGPMVMRDAEGDILNTGTGGGKPAKDLTLNFVPVSFPLYSPAVLHVVPARRELWRIVNASAVTYLDLQVLFEDRIQALGVVGIDGVPLSSAHGVPGDILWQSHALLPPGARIDIIVRMPPRGLKASVITRMVDTGPAGENDPTRPLAALIADAEDSPPMRMTKSVAAKTVALPAASLPTGESWLGDAAPARTRRLYFSEQPRDPANPSGPADFFITPDGQAPRLFDPTSDVPSIVVHAGDVEDWIIENRTTELHAFHIHQIHFLLLGWNGIPVDEPYLRDIVNVSYWDGTSGQYPSVRLRMDFRDPKIVGTFVYHCHLLEHEDGGMMGLIQVLPRIAPHQLIPSQRLLLHAGTGHLHPAVTSNR